MGVGDCPEETKVQLLQQVVELDLGFSEVQLRSAINHLVKEFGSSEEALAWIQQDNFTILVNYILDDGTDLKSQERRSPASCDETRTLGSLSMQSAQEANVGTEERRKGANPPIKGVVQKESLGGRLSSGNVPFNVEQSGDKIEQWKKISPSQRCLMDRNELRKHYKKKLSTDLVKASDRSTDSELNQDRVSTSQTQHMTSGNPSGQPISNKKSRISVEQGEQMISKVALLQRANSIDTNSEDHKARKKKASELSRSKINPCSSQIPGKIPEPEAAKDLLSEARTLIPSGCQDLATGCRSSQFVKNKISDHNTRRFSQSQSSLAAQDDWSQVEIVAEQNGERKTAVHAAKERPNVLVDLDGAEEIPSTSSSFKFMDNGYMVRETETCRAEVLPSNNDRQKPSCSVPDGFPVKEDQDQASYDVWILQMEAFLKEGNCQGALEALQAWKQKAQKVGTSQIEGNHLEGRGHEMVADIPGKKRGFVVSCDISRGLEKLPISCVNEYNLSILPENFLYVTRSVIRQAAHVDISLSRIGDLHCCCSDDCLRSEEACKCTDSTRGEYAYDKDGRLIECLAVNFQSGCTTRDGDFIVECCDKCQCSMNCGNRIVQRGITRKLQVFMTPTSKGWGVRALERIPARSFVCEYLGEIATNSEQFFRNLEYVKNGVYTYTMNLDGDIDMEKHHFKEGLTDEEALVLDATIFGNVSRFVNHRCNDANLFMRPVQIETRDTHYYHAAFFAMRDIDEMEELTWDYGIDFQDNTHMVKAFRCHCKSSSCRDEKSPYKRDKPKKGKIVKSSLLKHKVGQNERR